jgi:dephospho-CoA kinase
LQHAAANTPVVVFDIPLLYETKAEQQLDLVLVVSAPAEVQQQRVLSRPGMTPEKLAAILARQASQGSRCTSTQDT